MQADHNIATEGLQVEMKELDERLETMEQRGVELERNLRDCTNGSLNCSPEDRQTSPAVCVRK